MLSLLKRVWHWCADVLLPQSALQQRALLLDVHTLLSLVGNAPHDAVLGNERVFVLGTFQTPILKTAIHLLKYKGKTDVGRVCGEALGHIFREDAADTVLFAGSRPIIVIPIPLSTARLRERGYNQSEIIAKSFLQTSGLRATMCTDCITRVRNTKTQTELGRREREKNMHGVFAVTQPEKIHGAIIILVDDVITTGATMRAARDTLRIAGAHEVLAVAVAH